MPRLEVRIGYLIYGGVAVLVGVMFWLAQGRHMLLNAIGDDFTRLQEAARTTRVAADVAGELSALSAAIREYVASDAIEPPERIAAAARSLVATVGRAGGNLAAETQAYLASFEAVVAARRQRQERINLLGQAAGRLRGAADAAGQQQRFAQLREAEFNYLAGRSRTEARVLGERTAALAAAMPRGAAAVAEYDLAFARVAEIFDVLDRGAVRVLDDHDARLRGIALAIGRRAQDGEIDAARSFRESLSEAVRRNVEVVVVALLIAFLGAFLLLRHVIFPVNRMTRTMTAIAAGDYSLDVPYVARGDEIGQMARSLSTFRKALLELKSAQTQAETASRHKSDFIANMSHELRTPLNAIIGLSDMLLEDADDPDPRELKESLPRIATAAKHLLSLINEILDLSRIEAGRMAIEISEFKPAMLAEESLATVAPIARQKGLKLSAHYSQHIPMIESDPRRVRQILINLLGNAVKFTDSGEVRIEVTSVDDRVRFSVIDTGPGIAQEDIGRLFQDFTQLDASSTRKYGGSGLGLALSRRLARLIGGDVNLASTVGVGTTFVLELPLRAPPVATDSQPADGGGLATVGKGRTVEGGGDRA